MDQDLQALFLKEELDSVWRDLSEAAGADSLIRKLELESCPGENAKNDHSRLWPLLPLIVCESISGQFQAALPAAAALQLIRASAEIFDDIEDADSSVSLSARCGTAVATNLATSLLIVAERTLTRLRERNINDEIIVNILQAVNTYLFSACAGQHLDLSSADSQQFTEDQYLEITCAKSASFIECSCYTGAVLAGTKQGLIDQFSKFGRNLGMAAQIANDIQGIIRGSDLLKHKVTLPIIFGLSQADKLTREKLVDSFHIHFESVADTFRIRDLLFRCGAMYYTTIRMEMFKQQAADILLEVEDMLTSAAKLRLFL